MLLGDPGVAEWSEILDDVKVYFGKGYDVRASDKASTTWTSQDTNRRDSKQQALVVPVPKGCSSGARGRAVRPFTLLCYMLLESGCCFLQGGWGRPSSMLRMPLMLICPTGKHRCHRHHVTGTHREQENSSADSHGFPQPSTGHTSWPGLCSQGPGHPRPWLASLLFTLRGIHLCESLPKVLIRPF